MDEVEKRAEHGFLEYAGAVIKARAISNIEDNLKPVHKRVLWTYWNRKLYDTAKTQKCATISGAVLAYHPHGDVSVYDTMVRLAQPWKMRYPLVDFQGNVGNILGDSAAASRYTESKLSKVGMLMLEDIDKNCVKMVDNYDATLKEPELLPSKFPNILCNGSLGIAVGISASLVPFNYNEVASGIEAYIKNPNLTAEELIKIIPGPDFPVGGQIVDGEKLLDIYKTGRGTVTCRSHYHFEKVNGRDDIVFTDLPYLVEVEDGVVKPLKKLVNDDKCDFFYDIQNNTNEKQVEIHIILEKGTPIHSALYLLFSKTKLETTVKINNNVLVNGEPETVNMIGLIKGYTEHRNNVIINIAKNTLEKLTHDLTITLGLEKCTSDIDNVVKIIRNAENRSAAKSGLMEKYVLNEEQVNAVLDMKLSRLSKLDVQDLANKEKELNEEIVKQKDIIDKPEVRNAIIIQQLEDMRKICGDKRRTEIQVSEGTNHAAENRKSQNYYNYESGISVLTPTKNCRDIIFTNSIDNIVCFDKGGRIFKAKEVVNNDGFFKKEDKEFIISITKGGLIKKTVASDYADRTIKLMKIKDGDSMFYCKYANDTDFIFISCGEKILKLLCSDLTATGTNTQGIKIKLDHVDCCFVGSEEEKLVVVDKDNKGKITSLKSCKTSGKTSVGQHIDFTIAFVKPYRDEMLLITTKVESIKISKLCSVKNIDGIGARISNKQIINIV